MGVRTIFNINNLVATAFKRRNLQTRPDAGPGVQWCVLLPACIMVGATRIEDVSPSYCIAAAVSLGLALAALLNALRLLEDTPGPINKQYSSSVIGTMFYMPASLVILILWISEVKGFLPSVWIGVSSVLTFHILMSKLLRTFPKTFTFGEACIIAQSVVIFGVCSVCNLVEKRGQMYMDNDEIITIILQAGLLGCAATWIVCSVFPRLRTLLKFCCLVVWIMGGGVVPMLWIVLRTNPLEWIAGFVLGNGMRILLAAYWAVCCVLAVTVVITQLKAQQKATTAIRKYFHALMLAVYIPGLMQDCSLLYLASGVILALFVLVELMRAHDVKPVASHLNSSFQMFVDEKDQGKLVLTHIYLLIGCSSPLWLYPLGCVNLHHIPLPLLSGLLSIGVGDSAASVVGSKFGTHHWAGTKKTYEGTIAAVMSQIIVVTGFLSAGLLPSDVFSVVSLLVAIVVTSVIEAKTDQVDNLVLPLVMYLFLVI